MKQRNILLVMSDQHGWMNTGCADERQDTPHLQRIAEDGVLFDHCYCNAPLCVPSRMSFLTGLMPSELGIFNNDSVLLSDVPTLAHELGRMGYETVLIGRMHFKGDDQRHGFDQHLYGDITSQYWGTGGRSRRDFGIYAGTTNRLHCTEVAGGGISPVMVYDENVWQQAMNFLQRWETEGRAQPLFLLVGFYGPHFPFVCKEELYHKYQKRWSLEECGREAVMSALSCYEDYIQECEAERMRNCRAAYSGLVERLDEYTGALYDRFRQACKDKNHLFVYLSDHGEQLGKRGIFGKQSLYEHAVRVPLVMEGTGIAPGLCQEPVGLLDVSRTILSLGALSNREESEADGWHQGKRIDLEHPDFGRHWIRIQQMLEQKGAPVLAEAAVLGQYKVVQISGQWYVYDLEADPMEERNLMESWPDKGQELVRMAELAGCFADSDQRKSLVEQERKTRARHKRLKEWGRAKSPREWGTIHILPGMLKEPAES